MFVISSAIISCTLFQTFSPIKPKATESCKEEPIKVAVIDTGFDFGGQVIPNAHLCNYGHEDFTDGETIKDPKLWSAIPMDVTGHGTNIVGLINKYAGNANYCIIILKFWKSDEDAYGENLLNEVRAIEYATSIKADIINISGGGENYRDMEAEAVKSFLDTGGIMVTAAGNTGKDLTVLPFYPAMCDSRVVVVGSLNNEGVKSNTSNYGKEVKAWEIGEHQEAYGVSMSGTSQAAAIRTGKTLAHLKNKCYKVKGT
jgi:subtilisin family serine protease